MHGGQIWKNQGENGKDVRIEHLGEYAARLRNMIKCAGIPLWSFDR